MEALGGLIKRMPWTAACFLLGSAAIAALPPLNGFVSEWLTFQALLQNVRVAEPGLLAGLAVSISIFARKPGLLFVAAAVVLLKAWLIPRALGRIAAGVPVRAVAPGRSAGMSLLVAGILVVAAYAIMLPVTQAATLPTRGAIPLAFAMALIGLFVCVTGRDALGHILGFLMFENGIFGLALLATYGLPGIVEAGVFLDVLVIVLIMEGVVVQLRGEHASSDVDRLRQLRG
jgi:hydrogenase-4 component E